MFEHYLVVAGYGVGSGGLVAGGYGGGDRDGHRAG